MLANLGTEGIRVPRVGRRAGPRTGGEGRAGGSGAALGKGLNCQEERARLGLKAEEVRAMLYSTCKINKNCVCYMSGDC